MDKSLKIFFTIQVLTTMTFGLSSVALSEPVQILWPSTIDYGSNKVESYNFVGIAKISCRQLSTDDIKIDSRRGKCIVIRTVEGFTIYFGNFLFNFRNYFSPSDNHIELLKSLYGKNDIFFDIYLESIPDRIYRINIPTRTPGKQKVYIEPSLVARKLDNSKWEITPYDFVSERSIKAKPSLFELEFDNFNDALRFFYPTR
jgi:hypothetical protein